MNINMRHLKAALCLGVASVAATHATADDHTVLPTVTVVADYDVDFSFYGGYWPSFDVVVSFPDISAYDGSAWMGHEQMAQLELASKALRSSSVCDHSDQNVRSTLSTSDELSRWLAATAVFNRQNSINLLGSYLALTSSTRFLFDGKIYQGFKVRYADGASEVWPINPGYKYSSVKLLSQPLPNSQRPWDGFHGTSPKCNVG